MQSVLTCTYYSVMFWARCYYSIESYHCSSTMRYVACIPFFMCISFATYERVASSKEVAASVNKGPPRISTNEYSTCYDDLHVSDENKCKIFMKLKFDIEKEKGINFRALSPCLQSVVGNLHFNSVGAKENSVGILIIRPN